MIQIFIFALFGGILSTLPPGPLNLRLALLHIRKQKHLVRSLQCGIILGDASISILALYCSIRTTNLINKFIHHQHKLILIGEIIFILILLTTSLVHIYSYFNRNNIKQINHTIKNSNSLMTFFFGIVGTLAIPGLIPFWYFWWIGFSKYLNMTNLSFAFLAVFFGLIVGDSIIFSSYRYLANVLFSKNKSTFSIVHIELFVGIIFLMCAIFFIVSAIV